MRRRRQANNQCSNRQKILILLFASVASLGLRHVWLQANPPHPPHLQHAPPPRELSDKVRAFLRTAEGQLEAGASEVFHEIRDLSSGKLLGDFDLLDDGDDFPPVESVPKLVPESHHELPAFDKESHLKLPAFDKESHHELPAFDKEPHLKLPAFDKESHLKLPAFDKESQLKLPAFAKESHHELPAFDKESHHELPAFEASHEGNRPRVDGRGRKLIGYAITITKDGAYVDGAAVLGESIRQAHEKSRYGYDLVAIVHPSVTKARQPLEYLGWRIVEKDVPFDLSEIENQEYAKEVRSNGCCGHLELLKLHAWGLTEYHRVVHLDMDSFILGAMDELFDQDKSLIYTRDYNMSPGRPLDLAPVQGGFLLVKPSMQEYEALWGVVKKGDFQHGGGGWGGSHIGNFWGGMTIQGLVPYYFMKIAPPEASLEVDRCVYNQMVDAAGDPTSRSAPLAKMQVPNCRKTTFEETMNVHFTICQKPWWCLGGHRQPLCMQYHKAWLRVRDDLEKRFELPPSHSCARSGEAAYVPLKIPGAEGGGDVTRRGSLCL